MIKEAFWVGWDGMGWMGLGWVGLGWLSKVRGSLRASLNIFCLLSSTAYAALQFDSDNCRDRERHHVKMFVELSFTNHTCQDTTDTVSSVIEEYFIAPLEEFKKEFKKCFF